jgi:hypothetical protein
MILEGIVTTLDESGALNVAPMGPIVDDALTRLTLRPFQASQTYRNLKAHGCGVFHVTDDVLLIAQAALDRLPELPATFPAEQVAGRVLVDCCRWFEFRVVTLDDSQERTHVEAVVVHTGRRRDFFGFNRAKHAVLEATILATRLHLIPADEVRAELTRLRIPVEKTAGPRERAAWELVANYVDEWFAQHHQTSEVF